MGDQPKDKWDKAGIILQPIGGLFAAMAVAALGLIGSNLVNRNQNFEARLRLQTELMGRREESESALRKDMFNSILTTFLQPEAASLDAKVLNLELLAYNFHESLNLKPLFLELRRRIDSRPPPNAGEYTVRVERIAKEITKKQLLVLQGHGQSFNRHVSLESLRDSPGGLALEEGNLSLGGITRTFRIVVLQADPKARELRLRLGIISKSAGGELIDQDIEFSVGFFDFPMIDSTRLSDDQRFAVTLTNFGESSAEISGSYFPGAYASLKEKPYLDELFQKLWGDAVPR
jgi:hypothetical protein